MKEIQPVSTWDNGQIVIATILNMNSISDDLSTIAIFNYQLLSDTNIPLAQGNLTMDGTDYVNYSTNTDSNDYAYQWGAGKLNLTLV
jgi:hypothetical protein